MESIQSIESHKSTASSNINVICRFRPSSDSSGGPKILSPFIIEGNRIEYVTSEEASRVFEFDRVFGEGASQQELFTEEIQGILDALLAGFNGTVSCNATLEFILTFNYNR
jgi:hypothetical protein